MTIVLDRFTRRRRFPYLANPTSNFLTLINFNDKCS
jgi:hypothetical protein